MKHVPTPHDAIALYVRKKQPEAEHIARLVTNMATLLAASWEELRDQKATVLLSVSLSDSQEVVELQAVSQDHGWKFLQRL